MRTLRACAAVVALALSGGCLGDGGSVMLTVSQAMGLSPQVSGYTASNATANVDSMATVHFTATSSQGTLTMLVAGPLLAGMSYDLSQEHNFVSLDLPGSGFSSNGGMLAVDGVNPYRVRLVSVPMLHGSGAAMGGFVLDGSGTFK